MGWNQSNTKGNVNSGNSQSMNGLIGAGIGAASSAIGMIGQRQRERRTNKQNEKLMGMQHENQKKLNQQGHDLSMDMWNKTNYEAQMKHMKEAGVNPALMYGQGGGGGTTANSGSGGSAAMGSAAQPQQMMDIGSSMMQGAQMSLIESQRKNIDSETKLNEEKAGDTHESGRGKYLANMITKMTMGQTSGDAGDVAADRSRRYGDGTIQVDSYVARTNAAESNNAEQQLENMKASEQKDLMNVITQEVEQQLAKSKMSLNAEAERKLYHDIIVNYINAGSKGLESIVNAATRGLSGAAKGAKKSGSGTGLDKNGEWFIQK